MEVLTFQVFGDPKPEGSKRAFATKNGKVVVTDANRGLIPWRDRIMSAALEAKGNRPTITLPVRLVLSFWLPRPKSKPKTRDVFPTSKPDVDKLVRAVNDSLVDAGVIGDDSQVVGLSAFKYYSVTPDMTSIYKPLFHRPPGVAVTVIPMKEEVPGVNGETR